MKKTGYRYCTAHESIEVDEVNACIWSIMEDDSRNKVPCVLVPTYIEDNA